MKTVKNYNTFSYTTRKGQDIKLSFSVYNPDTAKHTKFDDYLNPILANTDPLNNAPLFLLREWFDDTPALSVQVAIDVDDNKLCTVTIPKSTLEPIRSPTTRFSCHGRNKTTNEIELLFNGTLNLISV